MEFNLKTYMPQYRKRGCLVLTRVDAWRDPKEEYPSMDYPGPHH